MPKLVIFTRVDFKGKTVEYHLNPIGWSQVGMLYIVGNVSPNATRIYTFRRCFFSLTAVIEWKRQSLFILFNNAPTFDYVMFTSGV